jgi:hypothetical protein
MPSDLSVKNDSSVCKSALDWLTVDAAEIAKVTSRNLFTLRGQTNPPATFDAVSVVRGSSSNEDSEPTQISSDAEAAVTPRFTTRTSFMHRMDARSSDEKVRSVSIQLAWAMSGMFMRDIIESLCPRRDLSKR